jgi:hypothetical protein
VLDHGHARLTPALVRSGPRDEAQIEADYDFDQGNLDLAISTGGMQVASLRAQVSLAAVPWLDQIKSGSWSGDLHYHFAAPRGEPRQTADAKPGWSGDIQVEQADVPVPGVAGPIHLDTAHARIEGAHVAIDRIHGNAGQLKFTGDYTYQPGAARPHRLHLRAAQWDAADLEAQCMPTLRRASSLFARALGRVPMPDWLRTRAADATLQIDSLVLADLPLENLRARLAWDGPRIELENVQAKLEGASLTGRLSVNLRGARPVYSFAGRVKGLSWQSGKLDAEGTIDTAGIGRQLVANLVSAGTFAGTALDLGQVAPYRSASGAYTLAWAQGVPRFRFTSLSLRGEDDTYTGHGATQDDGKLLLLLSDGTKEIRVSGSPAKLRLEDATR